MSKPGRPPKKDNKNPFNPADEAAYLSWDHGHNAQSMEDCPYDAKDSDAREAYSAWMQGFKANKSRPKPVRNVDPEAILDNLEAEEGLSYIPGPLGPITLDSINTNDLEAELKKRKIKDLEQLLQKETALLKALEEIRVKVLRLKVLMGD